MGLNLHTIELIPGTGGPRKDILRYGFIADLASPAGNGDPTAVAAGTPGAGYQTIPTASFANAGSGSGATVSAVMGVVGVPTVAAGGSGGTNGTQTVTGTTGTGTKFQASVTIAGGAITAVNSVSVAGAYTAMPTTLTAEPVTGASLTGATLNLSAAMGVVSYTVGGSSNHAYAQGTTVSLSGGTPSTAAVPGAVTVTTAAGQSASMAINASNVPGLSLPPKYAVQVEPNQDANAYVTNKTTTGFTVILNPRLASNSLAAGTIDITITA